MPNKLKLPMANFIPQVTAFTTSKFTTKTIINNFNDIIIQVNDCF